jgi:hypothetical protein
MTTMGPDYWASAEAPDQVLPPGAEPVAEPVRRLQGLLDQRAAAFAEARFGTRDGIDLRLGRRGLLPDEAASFLRAFDAGLLEIDETGGVRVNGCRPKPGGGRYSLFSANRYGGDLYVSLNLEYLIQLGAACELIAFHGWSGDEVEFEVGEFDALAHTEGRVVLAMEAKTRVSGPDSLTSLWHAFIESGSAESPPEPVDNHSRKYVELLRLTEAGPVVLWLVAAQARWASLATRVDSHVEFAPFQGVDRHEVGDNVSSRHDEPVTPGRPPAPNVDHALELARLTEWDGQQRCYEFPWRNEGELDAFGRELRAGVDLAGLKHSRAWKWCAERSTGPALSPSGRATGLEMRLSYYAK